MPKFDIGENVKATLIDGNVKDAPGKIIGHATNSDGECVYLVEMQSAAQAGYGRQVGSAQIERGKKWVLSLYEEELEPAVMEPA